MKRMKAVLLGLLITLPVVTLAQPAPIHNPVVARMPCTMGAAKVSTAGYEAKPVRASYSLGSTTDSASARHTSAGKSGWATDVRREIGLGFNSLCN
jgi:hypothetical protein